MVNWRIFFPLRIANVWAAGLISVSQPVTVTESLSLSANATGTITTAEVNIAIKALIILLHILMA
jgi:hypothetical protein